MKTITFFALCLAIITASCGAYQLSAPSNSTNSSSADSGRTNTENPASYSKSVSNTGGGGGGREESTAQDISLNQTQQSQTTPVAIDRKIIRNAELNLEADVPEESQKKIGEIAEGKGGFVVESQQSSSDVRSKSRDTVTMTVRVPADKFTEAIDEIRKTASRVIVETIKGQDVTEEFIDIEARLKAKKALEAQFTEIMKRANSVEDALSVQSQLAEVRSEIEKIEGRKRFLENQASLSTIKIRIQTPTAISASSTGFFYQLTEAFSDGFDAALTFILGLVRFLIAIVPFLLFIVLPVYLIIRYFWRKRKKPVTVSDIAEEELKSE